MVSITKRIADRWPRTFTFIYIFISHGLGSGIISGGIEFAIAYGMYHHIDRGKHVKMWGFPYTLSGDLALTLFIQIFVTWILEEIFVGWDIHLNNSGKISIEDKQYLQQNHRILWLLDCNRGILPLPEEKSNKIIFSGKEFKLFLKKQFLRYGEDHSFFWCLIEWCLRKLLRFAFPLAFTAFIFIWSVTLGIMAAPSLTIKHVHNDFLYNNYPFPQLLKLVYGVVIGLLTTPLIVIGIILRNEIYRKRVDNGETIDYWNDANKENNNLNDNNKYISNNSVEFESNATTNTTTSDSINTTSTSNKTIIDRNNTKFSEEVRNLFFYSTKF